MDINSIDKVRKRRFFHYYLAVITPIIIGFTIVDYLEGQILEILFDVIFGLVNISAYLVIKNYDLDTQVYRIACALGSINFIYAVIIDSGNGTILYWLFPLPPIFFFFLEKREGLIGAIILGLGTATILLTPLGIHNYDFQISIRFLISYTFVTFIAYVLESSRQHFSDLLVKEHKKLKAEKDHLEEAINQIKTLSGLLPICANCKKIRNDDGYWQDVAVYIRNHSDADFSHGICPDCVEQLYPMLKKK